MNRPSKIKSVLTNTVIDFDNKSRKVVACFSAFNNKDYDNDIILKGAYAKTLKERFATAQVWILKNHNEADNLTKPFEAYETEQGLIMGFECPNTQLGNDTFELYKAGIYDQHSVKIATIKSHEEEGVNIITEAFLFEGSFVLWGANPLTPTISVGKSASTEYLDKIKAVKKGWNGSYKTFQELEFIETELSKNMEDLNKIQEKSGVPIPNAESKIIVTDKNIKDAEVIKKGMYNRIQVYKEQNNVTELTALQQTECTFLEDTEYYLQSIIRCSSSGLISANTSSLAKSIIQFAMNNIDAIHALEEKLYPTGMPCEDGEGESEDGIMEMGCTPKPTMKSIENTEPLKDTQPLNNKSILLEIEKILLK